MNIIFIFFIIFTPILLIFSMIDYFSYRNWTSIIITFNDEHYFKVVDKLKQAGIQYKTKSLFNQTTTQMFGGNRQRQYEIYVKKNDTHKATQQLNS
jgi:hypothetical protein